MALDILEVLVGVMFAGSVLLLAVYMICAPGGPNYADPEDYHRESER